MLRERVVCFEGLRASALMNFLERAGRYDYAERQSTTFVALGFKALRRRGHRVPEGCHCTVTVSEQVARQAWCAAQATAPVAVQPPLIG